MTAALIQFYDQTLNAQMFDGVPCVAVRPICAALGLSWSSQRKRINRDPRLSEAVVMMTTVAGDGKQRNTLCLPLSKLNGWLFGVEVSRVRPELRERLTRYQRECFDVLARHFGLSAPDGLTALQAKMHAVELTELASFRHAQTCSLGMNRRRKEKRLNAEQLASLRAEVQMTLALIGGAA
jgi:hypothetical protein